MSDHRRYPLLVILGPTASGKTALAANIAFKCRGEVISADSRQVYRDMNLGTGKDYADYLIEDHAIPVHLLDIVPAGEKYNVFEFQKDFWRIYPEIYYRNNLPILCGGSGLYIDAVIHDYQLVQVPINPELRKNLEEKSIDELVAILSKLRKLHNKSDISEKKRLIRAIEIAMYEMEYGQPPEQEIKLKTIVFGMQTELNFRRKKITSRLHSRLKAGMVDEVKALLNKGITADQLIYYGLEYKFITQYISGMLKYEEMVSLLNIAIHQFAKRQMTWFRKMEKEGTEIHWLDATESPLNNTEIVIDLLRKHDEFSGFLY